MARLHVDGFILAVMASCVTASYNLTRLSACKDSHGATGDCYPGTEICGRVFHDAPTFHLMDQNGCGENDPNGPVFDPVHGVIHHFYQDHLAAKPGYGPVYGHFVSKDFVSWAQLPVAIWNGLDSSVWPPRATPYDNKAIYTGSAVVVDGAGPGGRGPGVVQIYPGLCNKKDWASCRTGTLLAQAVPADYAGDPLLTNWTKPSYNPIVENTQRDPSTPWKTPDGEWRLRTSDSMAYGSASDADLLVGKWYTIGKSKTMRSGECPSFYPLPGPTPGFEEAYHANAGTLPTHVHKWSFGVDCWQLGTYDPGPKNSTGSFTATPGWEDLYKRKNVDTNTFYASKDNEYPIKDGGKRRINWGWARVPPSSTQSLPREITFNAAARTLQQIPIAELQTLRGPAAASKSGAKIAPGAALDLGLAAGVAKHSETVVVFELPSVQTTLSVDVGGLRCNASYSPPVEASVAGQLIDVPVACGSFRDVLRLVPGESAIEIRSFADATFLEVFFQQGRVAMTVRSTLDDTSRIALEASNPATVREYHVYPMKSIWVSADKVRSAPRVYPSAQTAVAQEAEDIVI